MRILPTPNDAVKRDRVLMDALPGCYLGEAKRGRLTGGRTIALARLRDYDVTNYGRSRNHIDAPVSRLSPYLRHGMLSIVEVRDHLRNKYATEPQRAEEFLRQLAWRDFFEKVLDWYGDALDDDLEEPKHASQRQDRIPLDIVEGRTGLPCVDGMLRELFTDGYLHNHERLWFAAYLCHFRGIDWKRGARLFRQYLYDGDIASNSSSWQWVESTFASKPYFMNKQNIATFSDNRWCDDCRVKCPFDAPYETLQHRLFGGNRAPLAGNIADALPQNIAPIPPDEPYAGTKYERIVWLHDAALSVDNPALVSNPNAAVLFAFDAPALRTEPWAFHRLAFLFDGVHDLFNKANNPDKITVATDAVTAIETVAASGAEIHVTDHPNPTVRKTVQALKSRFRVIVYPRPVIAEYAEEPRRFSRYWEKAAIQVLGYRPKKADKWHK